MKILFEIIWDNISFVFSILKKIIEKFMDYKKNMQLKRIMGFKHKVVAVTFSVFKKEMVNNSLHELVTINCLEYLKALMDICKKLEIDCEIPIGNRMDLLQRYENSDEIHIGGPLTNSYVHSYLSDFSKFTFYRKAEDNIENINYRIENSCIKISESERGRYIRIANVDYYVDDEKDYLILIRHRPIIEKKVSKTVHIIFNTHHIEKVNVIKIFINNTEILFNRIKRHKNNYFLIIPIDKNNGRVEIENIEDKTDIFFD